mmetsp:Transcript_20795/g.33504  ORF Transcript_20795/g.33504 Transcript_20795/m.33504 type:complete len:567 (+) Transcript_20795:200-1900(+)
MPTSSPFAQRNTSVNETPQEDCRDYLRTGRCKYGASCKYNHPPNVQSGGGMKTPIDPSEPLFPIRPNEPVCQYYMKHGTCKFGQACKFHHPPQVAGTANMVNNNNAVLVSVPIGRKGEGTQGIWTQGNDTGVQILPQRPDEPNCIYFLKNGRCKYGATCRYHHPLNYHDRGRGGFDDSSRTRHTIAQQDQRNGPKVHYLASLPPGSMQQGHFVVADGTVTFLSLDGSAPAHVVSLPQSSSSSGGGGKEGTVVYTAAAPGTVTSSSSSTSIASSFETALSNVEAQDSSSSLWNRKATAGSSGGYNLPPEPSVHGRNSVQGNRAVIVQNVGEGGSLGLPRVVSTGSASDGSTVYYDANGPTSTAWRTSRSSSFDHTRSRGTNHHSQDEELQRSMSVQSALDEEGRPRHRSSTSPMMQMRTHHGIRSHRPPGEVDEGLSQMTSALLTMLDTPEEAAAHQAGYDIEDEQRSLTPRMGTRYSSRAAGSGSNDYDHDRQLPLHYSQPPSYLDTIGKEPGNQATDNQTGWIPPWQESGTARGIHENQQPLNVMPPQSSSSTHHSSSHVGLYLP